MICEQNKKQLRLRAVEMRVLWVFIGDWVKGKFLSAFSFSSYFLHRQSCELPSDFYRKKIDKKDFYPKKIDKKEQKKMDAMFPLECRVK